MEETSFFTEESVQKWMSKYKMKIKQREVILEKNNIGENFSEIFRR
jgi:hypothetical protein